METSFVGQHNENTKQNKISSDVRKQGCGGAFNSVLLK